MLTVLCCVRIMFNQSIKVFFFTFTPGELEVGSAPFVEQDVHRGTLHIRGVQEVDAGQYSCVASSSAGTSAGTVSLEVGGETTVYDPHKAYFSFKSSLKGKSNLPSTAGPLFSEAPVDVTASVGENITLPCTARGVPRPTVTWRRQDGRQIPTWTDSYSKTKHLENGHLLIQSELFRKRNHSNKHGSVGRNSPNVVLH